MSSENLPLPQKADEDEIKIKQLSFVPPILRGVRPVNVEDGKVVTNIEVVALNPNSSALLRPPMFKLSQLQRFLFQYKGFKISTEELKRFINDLVTKYGVDSVLYVTFLSYIRHNLLDFTGEREGLVAFRRTEEKYFNIDKALLNRFWKSKNLPIRFVTPIITNKEIV